MIHRALLLFLTGFLIFTSLKPVPSTNRNAFVETKEGRFMINGEPFRFAGTNAYYLPNYEKLDPDVVNHTFEMLDRTGITVIRMWAFYDGYDCGYSRKDSTENVIQTAPGQYNESALRDLDRVIAKGKRHGMRFILPFVNYWNDLGGICQYNTWAGAKDPDKNMSFFISNPKTQKWYRDYIKMLLNRVNTVTGVAYKDEPAILSWQIINEGRNPNEDPAVLRDWYEEIARYIKNLAPNQLVGTGEEGFDENPSDYSVENYSNTYAIRAGEGTSYRLNTAIPDIDYGSAHWYPTEFGFGHEVNQELLEGQKAWFSDHQKIAKEYNKPFLLGEYGYPGWGNTSMMKFYTALWEQVEQLNLDGSLLWQFTVDGSKCYEFGGNICYPGARSDRFIYLRFRRHVDRISGSTP